MGGSPGFVGLRGGTQGKGGKEKASRKRIEFISAFQSGVGFLMYVTVMLCVEFLIGIRTSEARL